MSGGPWLAHEHPERPFDSMTWLCSCHACTLAVQGEAAMRPTTPIVLKGHTGRTRVTVAGWRDALAADGGTVLADGVGGLREVFVPADYNAS